MDKPRIPSQRRRTTLTPTTAILIGGKYIYQYILVEQLQLDPCRLLAMSLDEALDETLNRLFTHGSQGEAWLFAITLMDIEGGDLVARHADAGSNPIFERLTKTDDQELREIAGRRLRQRVAELCPPD